MRYIAALILLLVSAQSEPKHNYVVIYLEHHMPSGWSIDPCMAYGPCWTETKVAWFANVEDAERFLNSPKGDVFVQSDGAITKNILGGDDLVGLYEVKTITVRQEQVGTEKRLVTHTDEETVPKVEWRVKP